MKLALSSSLQGGPKKVSLIIFAITLSPASQLSIGPPCRLQQKMWDCAVACASDQAAHM